jgi:hypothetical protein
VSIVTRLWARQPGFDSWKGQGMNFFFIAASTLAMGPTHPPVQWVLRALSLWGLKQLGNEDDYSPPSYTEVKNVWRYTSTPLYILYIMVLK